MHRQTTIGSTRPHLTREDELIVLEYLPMVRGIAKRIHQRLPRNVEIDDLVSAGFLGLMEAYVRFSPSKNIGFASYANFRVRGAILDSLRTADWAPRHLRRQGREVRAAIRTLSAKLLREPTEEEVAAELKVGLRTYQKLRADLDSLTIGPLDRKRDPDSFDEDAIDVPCPPKDDPYFRCARGEMAARLTEAILDLPARERQVMTLLYVEDKSLLETGLTIGVEKAVVAQIRALAVLHLRAKLAGYSDRISHGPVEVRRNRTHALEDAVFCQQVA